MTRQITAFPCATEELVATLDTGTKASGLLIISGGNEIRSGAFGGMAQLAAHFAAQGFAVFRYDRRGIGDSSGSNDGYRSSAPDIGAAAKAFARLQPQLNNIVAFGNCDAATALALFAGDIPSIKSLVLANPWTIDEEAADAGPTAPAIRARYLRRLADPAAWADLAAGRINLGKLVGGLFRLVKGRKATVTADALANRLEQLEIPTQILLARRDMTASVFLSDWESSAFLGARANEFITLRQIDSASHSFADVPSRDFLYERIAAALRHD
ncbi:MAG: hydrolase 1, exosortase A system-associated [Parasphingorhabdus sp.]|nr:hydrolase 1, exosortase A system-associated [Parasphingorhabdus sp.]